MILQFEKEENFRAFISELNENNIKVRVEERSSDLTVTFPLEIIMIGAHLILALLIYFYVYHAKEKYALKKLLGYHPITIWFEDVKGFMIWIVGILMPLQIFLALVLLRGINVFFIKLVIQLLSMNLIQIIIIVMVIGLAHLQLRHVDFVHTLKKQNDLAKSMLLNRGFKLIPSVILIYLLVLTGSNMKLLYNTYDSTMKSWISIKEYVVLPTIQGIEHAYLTSSDFRKKQLELYKVLNKHGSIYADFNEYELFYNLRTRTIADEIATYCVVNPNYLELNPIYDTAHKPITISKEEKAYILIVPEKYQYLEEEILLLHQRYNTGLKSEVRDVEQEIKIIWSQDNQSIFSYNWDVNPLGGNSVENPIIVVLTEHNGKLSDYDKILGYKGNPVKIKGESENTYEYIYGILSEHQLDQYITQYYRIYDYLAPEIETKRNFMLYGTLGIVLTFGMSIVLIYQNIHIFFRVNRQKIVIKKLAGHSIVSKYHHFMSFYMIEWLVLSIFFKVTGTMGEMWQVTVAILMFIELMIYGICIRNFEKNIIVKFLKGECIGITGKSGAGKSTLLNIIGLLEPFDEGKLIIDGMDNIGVNSKQANMFLRHKISYIFRNFAMINNETIYYNLNVAMKYVKATKREKEEKMALALEEVGLHSGMLHQKPMN